MTPTAPTDVITIPIQELKVILREVVREVVHEELSKFAGVDDDWEIEDGSALWEDLTELKQEIHSGRLQLLSHTEVFG